MTVEFLLREEADMTNAKRNVAELLERIAGTVGLDPAWVDRVIVADYERFGEAVGYFDKTRIFTNANGLLAAGKTFPTSNTERPTSSSIILGLPIIAGIFNAGTARGWDLVTWTAEERHALYVLYHELGHCRDHTSRPQLVDDGTHRTPEGTRVVNYTVECLCKYHFSILYPELPACVFGAPGYTEECREQDRVMNNQFIRAQLSILRQDTINRAGELDYVFQQVAAVFWFILIQHMKYVGSAIGNPALAPRRPDELWELAVIDEDIANALIRAEEAIIAAWADYPEIKDGFREELAECFHEITAACGYKLEVRGGRDGVWWDGASRRVC